MAAAIRQGRLGGTLSSLDTSLITLPFDEPSS
jgi:hypothetical protein